MLNEKVIVANWKAWIGPSETGKWFEGFLPYYEPIPGLQVVIAVGYPQLAQAAAGISGHAGLAIAAQVISPYPVGGYTGAVPARWLKGLAEYVLVGHREREKYFHETDREFALQVSEARHAGLRPIVCMDRNQARSRIRAINHEGGESALFGYTPPEAESLEWVDDQREIIETAELITALSGGGRVLYGGGVDRKNAARLMSLPGLSGLLVGRGCLDPGDFVELLRGVASRL